MRHRFRKFCGLILAAALMPAVGMAQTVNETKYTYDALGRVTKVEYPKGAIINYQYDKAGNRTQVAVVGGTPAQVKVVVLPISGFVVIPIP